jgi:hypothetical protein
LERRVGLGTRENNRLMKSKFVRAESLSLAEREVPAQFGLAIRGSPMPLMCVPRSCSMSGGG